MHARKVMWMKTVTAADAIAQHDISIHAVSAVVWVVLSHLVCMAAIGSRQCVIPCRNLGDVTCPQFILQRISRMEGELFEPCRPCYARMGTQQNGNITPITTALITAGVPQHCMVWTVRNASMGYQGNCKLLVQCQDIQRTYRGHTEITTVRKFVEHVVSQNCPPQPQ